MVRHSDHAADVLQTEKRLLISIGDVGNILSSNSISES